MFNCGTTFGIYVVTTIHFVIVIIILQEAEEARKVLLELQAVASAVESTGQAKAEAQV